MSGMSYNWRKPLLLLLLFVLSLALVHVPAEAAPNITARWILDVHFDNGSIIATRRNQIFNFDQLVHQWDQLLPPSACKPLGAVTIGADRATFNGGAIRCDLPSFRRAVWEETGIILLPDGIIGGAQTDSWARVTIANLDFVTSGRHPLALHPDYQTQFAVTGTVASAELELDVANMQTTSIPFSFPSAVDVLVGSRLNECNGLDCVGKHYFNGPLSTELVTQGGPQQCTTGRTSVFVGSDGTEFLIGELVSLVYDPPCVATQG